MKTAVFLLLTSFFLRNCNCIDFLQEFKQAIENGDDITVWQILDEIPDIDVTKKLNSEGDTAVMYAARYCKGNLIPDLLNRMQEAWPPGEDVLAKKNENRETALIIAAANGNLVCVRDLLNWDDDFDVNEDQDGDGNTALNRAASGGYADICAELINRGAEVNTTNNRGTTPLMQAAVNCHLETVGLLMERGADPDLKNSDDYTARQLAIESGCGDVEDLLREKGPNNICGPLPDVDFGYADPDGGSLLGDTRDIICDIGFALLGSDASGRISCLENGVWTKPSPCQPVTITTIILSTAITHDETTTKLLPKEPNSELLSAASSGDTSGLRRWLSYANVNTRDGNGRTALILASKAGRNGVISVLLQAKADVEAVDNNGDTALLVAIKAGFLDAVKRLVEYGKANINHNDANGQTPWSIAVLNNHNDIANYLSQKGATV